MKTDYWFGVEAAMKGEIHEFVGNREFYTNGFVEGYMSVLQGVHFNWGDTEHKLHETHKR